MAIIPKNAGGIAQKALLVGIALIVVFAIVNYSEQGAATKKWIEENKTLIVLAIVGAAAWYIYLKKFINDWEEPRKVLERSLKDGYLSEFAFRGLTVSQIYGRQRAFNALRHVKIEPELAYLFIGEIFSIGKMDAIMLTGVRSNAGKIVRVFSTIPSEKEIDKMRDKDTKMDMLMKGKKIEKELRDAFDEKNEEVG